MDYAVHHDNVGELVATGVAVVVGRVAQTSRGRIIDEEDVVYTVMNVEVAVEQTWAGQMPTSAFTIERLAGSRSQGGPAGVAGSTSPASGSGRWKASCASSRATAGLLPRSGATPAGLGGARTRGPVPD